MKIRIALSFVLAAAVVASVFTLIQFGPTPGAVADGTVADNSEVIEGNTTNVGESATNITDDTRTSANSSDSPATGPIYVYPDGSLAPALGATPPDSSPRSTDDDDYDHDDHEGYEDHDDDEGRWWGRLTTLLSDDDHRSERDSDDYRVGYEDEDHDDDDEHDEDEDEDHDD